MDAPLYEGHGWTLRIETAVLPDGRKKTAPRVKLPDTAHILAFTSPGVVLLLREYRPFYGRYVWMIPSGKIDKEKDVKVGAMRELQEETGYAARDFREYGTFRGIESVNYICHLFIAKDLFKDPLPQDEHELIEVHEFPVDEAIEKVLSEPPPHTMSAVSLLKYRREFGIS